MIYNVNLLGAFDNRIHFDLGMGMNFSDPIVYTQLPYINLEWNGIFSNKLGIILGINYEYLSGGVRYSSNKNIPTNRHENINFLKYSIGQSWGTKFQNICQRKYYAIK